MHSMNSLDNNYHNHAANNNDNNCRGHNQSLIRSSLSDSDLIASSSSLSPPPQSSSLANQNTISLCRDLQVLILDDIDNHHNNDDDDDENSSAIFQSISCDNHSIANAINNDESLSSTKSMKKQSNKSRKSLFMMKKRKWISTPFGFITNCCMTRTDSIADLQQRSSTNDEDCQPQKQPIVKCQMLTGNGVVDQQTSGSINNINDNNNVVQRQHQHDHNFNDDDEDDNVVNGDAHRVNIDDDLSFMDNFPPLNQPLSRIVSLRRRHPNTPMSRSPEPPPLPPHPFPVGVVLSGFSNSYLHHPHLSSSHDSSHPEQQDNNISSISSSVNLNPNSAASLSSDDGGDDTYRHDNDVSVDGQHHHHQQQLQQPPHLYEPYSIQMPIMNHHIQMDTNNMNRSASRSTPTFHTQIDYINCLVPDLLAITNRSFYWGKMDRYEAERLLDGKPEGTFLLRDSAQEDHLFSVSFRRFERSLHARIENWEHRFSFDSHDPGVFSSTTVTGLIEHYKVPSHCMFFEPVLTKPLNRTFTFSLQHLARVTICDRVTYDSINRLPLPQILKSYLKEYHYRIKVRTKHFDESSLYRWLEPNHHHNQQQQQQQQPRVYFHQ